MRSRPGRWVHEFREREKPGGEFVLVCLTCLGAWDHRATDRLIEAIVNERIIIQEQLPIFEPWE